MDVASTSARARLKELSLRLIANKQRRAYEAFLAGAPACTREHLRGATRVYSPEADPILREIVWPGRGKLGQRTAAEITGYQYFECREDLARAQIDGAEGATSLPAILVLKHVNYEPVGEEHHCVPQLPLFRTDFFRALTILRCVWCPTWTFSAVFAADMSRGIAIESCAEVWPEELHGVALWGAV